MVEWWAAVVAGSSGDEGVIGGGSSGGSLGALARAAARGGVGHGGSRRGGGLFASAAVAGTSRRRRDSVRALRLAIFEALRGLAYLHERLLFHGRLTPRAVRMRRGGEVCLAWYGLDAMGVELADARSGRPVRGDGAGEGREDGDMNGATL